jgi:hypothetical protein
MNCEEAAEFASALCDGQTIPPEAAHHIGACATCRERLNAYAATGAELRRVASVERPVASNPGLWAREEKRIGLNWWREGKMTMRIPRFAFVLMLVLILFLSSSLFLVRARTDADEGVLVLTYRILPNGSNEECVVTTDANSGANHCVGKNSGAWGALTSSFRFVGKEGNRSELGIKTKYESQVRQPASESTDDLKDVPEQTVWIEPGEKQRISVSGLGEIELAGEYLDHMPALRHAPDETLDPRKNEFRIVSPVLVRGNEVLFNFAGSDSTDLGDPDAALMIYLPGKGRYLVSTVPFDGAIEGSVASGQIKFTLEDQDYVLLTAMPATRSDHVWVTHDPQYKLSEHMQGASDSKAWFITRSLSNLLQQRIQHVM